ncbi:DNA repair protein [Kocuria sp. CNJ-770]|uniref:Alpha-ketoglutarate-dependent dioxygenase AlkB family protein n=1 Tax=Kocuria oceani TaxID=988827 RepID=A0ABV9TKW2_9MICC|nr:MULTISPECIES: alpha-ketoglutarate-dependent dioxygenase AlkB [Kocuria]OLT04604.1 DNA repair protein [Kocuria sp. CNJ-770]
MTDPSTPFGVPELFELPRERAEIAPGAVHVPGWLDLARQRELVLRCREWATGPVPLRHAVLPGGGRMSVRSTTLGWDWAPYRYLRTGEHKRAPDMPGWLAELGRRAVAEACGEDSAEARDYRPDTALLNFYDATARMGMHQDRDEFSAAPIVSLSLGDACVFRFGNPQTRAAPYRDVELRSGDLFVFGGPSRYAFHGVPRILPGTAAPELGMKGGRLNLTLRMTGRAVPGR